MWAGSQPFMYPKYGKRKKVMKKKLVIILSVLVIFGFGIYVGRGTNQLKNITKIPSSSSSMIAMYIQDEEGNYQLSDAREFPKDGYVLNTEKSSCKNGGKITQNASTKALSLKVKTSDECTVYFDVVTSANPSADMLIAKANDSSITTYATGNKKEMFIFDHPEATQTTGWTDEERRDYRYIGNEPNNYITFNDETWRIIGVFTVETETGDKEQLIKIIRNESIENLPWDSTRNEWSTAQLQKFLNEDYYNNENSFKYNYINQYGNSQTITISKGLTSLSQKQIMKSKWYLGSASNNQNGQELYITERGTRTCVTTEQCSGETRTTSIIQNVGLMYPSDYIFTYAYGVDTKCYSNGTNCWTSSGGNPNSSWLLHKEYQNTLSPFDYNSISILVVYSTGGTFALSGKDNRTTRPSLYLSSSVRITGGDGSQSNPYTLAN